MPNFRIVFKQNYVLKIRLLQLHFKIHLPNVREELFFVNTYPKVSLHKVLEGKLSQRLSYLARFMYKNYFETPDSSSQKPTIRQA